MYCLGRRGGLEPVTFDDEKVSSELSHRTEAVMLLPNDEISSFFPKADFDYIM